MNRMPPLSTMLETATSLATLAAAGIVAWAVLGTTGGLQRSGAAQAPPQRETVQHVDAKTSIGLASKRNDAAKVAIVEFSDYECPFCGRYGRDIYPIIQRELVDKGIADYSFKHFPLEAIHKSAFKAGEASACAGEQGQFWGMHDVLFGNQAALDEPSLIGYGRSIGLDQSRFEDCLRRGSMSATVKADVEEGSRLGINSTPTFLIGTVQQDGQIKVMRKITGAQPFETFRQVVTEILAKQGPQKS